MQRLYICCTKFVTGCVTLLLLLRIDWLIFLFYIFILLQILDDVLTSSSTSGGADDEDAGASEEQEEENDSSTPEQNINEDAPGQDEKDEIEPKQEEIVGLKILLSEKEDEIIKRDELVARQREELHQQKE